jgi:transposase
VIPHGVDIFVGLEPIDLRWGVDRLAGVVLERVGRDSRGGALFVFFGRRRHILKILFCDGTGMCVFYKRLDQGTFRLPEPLDAQGTTVEIGERELDDLLDGIALETPKPPTQRRRVH